MTMVDLRRQGGRAAVAGALLAIGGNAVVLTADAKVPSDRVSYPLTSTAFSWGQAFFAVTQALMAIGILALVRSAVAVGRAGRVFGALAAAGMVLTVPGELVLIAAADSTTDSTAGSAASSLYGIAILLADVGLIGCGTLALRQHARPAALAVLPPVLGAFQLAVVTPVSLAAGFGSAASFVVIAAADLLVAAIGAALLSDSTNGLLRTEAATAV